MRFELALRADGRGRVEHVVTLAELIAVRPPHLRGSLAPGRRGPGGERPGRGQAPGLDFDGIGPYQPGDDVRRIDWWATARTGFVQMKRFAVQSHRARLIIADLHGELRFGTHERPMMKTAALITARLAWEAAILHEPVGLSLPGSLKTMKPRRGKRHVLRLLTAVEEACASASAAERGDLAATLLTAVEATQTGDEITLVSDLPEPTGPVLDAARGLSEARALTLYLVDDPIQHGRLAAGHYPSRQGNGSRQTFAIDRQAANEAASFAEADWRERRRQLLAAGWHVERAADVLPQSL